MVGKGLDASIRLQRLEAKAAAYVAQVCGIKTISKLDYRFIVNVALLRDGRSMDFKDVHTRRFTLDARRKTDYETSAGT